MWVAEYDITCDAFRAKRIADADLRDWHIVLNDEAGRKLHKIGKIQEHGINLESRTNSIIDAILGSHE